MMKYFLLAVLVFICSAGPAMADLVAVGEPVEAGSWCQEFSFTSDRYFDFLAINMIDGQLEDPYIFDMVPEPDQVLTVDLAIPTDVDVTSDYLSGWAMQQLSFKLEFAGDMGDEVKFDLLIMDWHKFGARYGWRYLGQSQAFWDGTTWTIDNSDLEVAIVPLPTAVVLGILGLGTAGIKLRKKKEV